MPSPLVPDSTAADVGIVLGAGIDAAMQTGDITCTLRPAHDARRTGHQPQDWRENSPESI